MKRVECHVIAGLGGLLFARGTKALDKLFDEISPIWDATHWWHRSWDKCAEGIIARQKRFRDKPTVILVGHSYGALRCQQIASRLRQNGITVDYIAGIDPTALPANVPTMNIPKNVRFVDEFWATSGWPALRRWFTPDGSRGGRFVVRGSWTTYRRKTVKGGHVACASNPITVRRIVEKVKELV